jgi:hypothetical protein
MWSRNIIHGCLLILSLKLCSNNQTTYDLRGDIAFCKSLQTLRNIFPFQYILLSHILLPVPDIAGDHSLFQLVPYVQAWLISWMGTPDNVFITSHTVYFPRVPFRSSRALCSARRYSDMQSVRFGSLTGRASLRAPCLTFRTTVSFSLQLLDDGPFMCCVCIYRI